MWKAVQFETIEKLNEFLTTFKREDKLEMTFNSNGLYGLFYWENVAESDEPVKGNSESTSESASVTESNSESDSTTEAESTSTSESNSESESDSSSNSESKQVKEVK